MHGGLRTVVGCLWGAWVGEWRGSGECEGMRGTRVGGHSGCAGVVVLRGAGVGVLRGAGIGVLRGKGLGVLRGAGVGVLRGAGVGV